MTTRTRRMTTRARNLSDVEKLVRTGTMEGRGVGGKLSAHESYSRVGGTGEDHAFCVSLG